MRSTFSCEHGPPYRYGLAIVMFTMFLLGLAQPTPKQVPPHGFTAFPYDVTPRSFENLDRLIREHANLYAIHRDQECLPWQALLDGTPFPRWLEQDWQEIASSIPEGHRVYVAITPTQGDRVSLAAACGEAEGMSVTMPAALRNASLDHPLVKAAYLRYARRVVEVFDPEFLVIGIEISELALNEPERWPAYEALAEFVMKALHRDYPQLQIGSEFVLQSLLLGRVGARVKPLIEKSDFLGISFYPYGSAYGERLGAPALPPPPDQWRQPLAWLRGYTTKPVGISETGYTTRTQRVAGLEFAGDERLQADFLRDIAATAVEDDYLFFIWFVPVDFDKLYDAIPGFPDFGRIWVDSGLFDENFEPKPAWSVWLEAF